MRRSRSWLASLVACVASCSGGAPQVPTAPAASLVRLSVTLSRASIQVGETALASAIGLDAGDRSVAVSGIAWQTSSPNIAAVSASGVVTAVAAGTATISATAAGKSASALITVTDVVRSTGRVTVSPDMGSVVTGQTLQMAAVVTDAAGAILPGRPLRWMSSSPGVATVSSSGLLTAVGAGTAIIIVASDGLTGSSPITVTAPVSTEMIVTISSPQPNEAVGDSLRVFATVRAPQPPARVVAEVGARQIPLGLVPAGPLGLGEGWGVMMPVQDFAVGFYRLVVTAIDAKGAVAADSVVFERNPDKVGGGSPSSPGFKLRMPVGPRGKP